MLWEQKRLPSFSNFLGLSFLFCQVGSSVLSKPPRWGGQQDQASQALWPHRLSTLPKVLDPVTETRSIQAARMQVGWGERTREQVQMSVKQKLPNFCFHHNLQSEKDTLLGNPASARAHTHTHTHAASLRCRLPVWPWSVSPLPAVQFLPCKSKTGKTTPWLQLLWRNTSTCVKCFMASTFLCKTLTIHNFHKTQPDYVYSTLMPSSHSIFSSFLILAETLWINFGTPLPGSWPPAGDEGLDLGNGNGGDRADSFGVTGYRGGGVRWLSPLGWWRCWGKADTHPGQTPQWPLAGVILNSRS